MDIDLIEGVESYLSHAIAMQKEQIRGMEDPPLPTSEKPDVKGLARERAKKILAKYFEEQLKRKFNAASISSDFGDPNIPLDKGSQKRMYVLVAAMLNLMAERSLRDKVSRTDWNYISEVMAAYGMAQLHIGMAMQVDVQRKYSARLNAAKSNTETYALRAEVIEYWRTNIDPAMSIEKAATLLTSQFPLSHRTLKEYISAEKKLRRASKA